jgi:hypothetical protein
MVALPSLHYGVTGWELDGALRRRLGQRLINAVATLRSLSRLVTSIESMPIEEHIRNKVDMALDHLDQVSYHT